MATDRLTQGKARMARNKLIARLQTAWEAHIMHMAGQQELFTLTLKDLGGRLVYKS